jgi:hypothetical protein
VGGIYGVATECRTKRGFKWQDPREPHQYESEHLLPSRRAFQNFSRRSARNYIDASVPVYPHIMRVVVLRLVRGN